MEPTVEQLEARILAFVKREFRIIPPGIDVARLSRRLAQDLHDNCVRGVR